MPVTGIYFAPLPATAASSAATLISHLRQRFPEQEPLQYHLDHRLFNDTSSQLPNSDPKSRTYTQILTLSHNPSTTFVGSTSLTQNKSKEAQSQSLSLITVPTSSVDSFTNLLTTKLQPHWYHRQSVTIENGMSISVKDNEWRISVGDVRVSPRSQTGSGQLRGMLIEVTHLEDDDDDEEQNAQKDNLDTWKKTEQDRYQSLLNAIFKGTGESFDASRIAVARIGTFEKVDNSESTKEKPSPDWELAKLYMEVLRGTRG